MLTAVCPALGTTPGDQQTFKADSSLKRRKDIVVRKKKMSGGKVQALKS